MELRGMAPGWLRVPPEPPAESAMRLLRGRRSMTFNAMSLITATVATDALGLVFWTVAARLRRELSWDTPRLRSQL